MPGLSPQHMHALHNPLIRAASVMRTSYREVTGDVSCRVLVARYKHLDPDGGSLILWHVAVMLLAPEGAPRDRTEWTRRDIRTANRHADRLIESVGMGPTWTGAEAGMSESAAEHRLRQLTARELGHIPLERIPLPVIDLYPPLDDVKPEPDA